MNLYGYIMGNPLSDRRESVNMMVPFAHRLALISDELYESAGVSCNGNYLSPDKNNSRCIKDLEAVHKCMDTVFASQVLDPSCPIPVTDDISDVILVDILQRKKRWCRDHNYVLSARWANDPRVQEALHIQNGTKDKWVRCNFTIPYDASTNSVVERHRSLLDTRYRALIYSGDHDMRVSYMVTIAWIRSLNMTVSDSWRPWLVDGQAAGFTEKFIHSQFTLTVLGAGHTAPEYKPKHCLKMLERWLADSDLESENLSYGGAAADYRSFESEL